MARPRRKCTVISNSDIETKQSSSLEDEKDVIETAQRIVRDVRTFCPNLLFDRDN